MNYSCLKRYNDKSIFVEEVKKKTYECEIKYHGCAQVIVQTFLDVFEEENTAASMAASPFAAGLALTGNNCGALIGGLMILGMVFGRKDLAEGLEGILKGIRPMRDLVRYFDSRYATVNCRDITGTDMADPRKAGEYFNDGGLEKCAAIMVDIAGFVADCIYEKKAEH